MNLENTQLIVIAMLNLDISMAIRHQYSPDGVRGLARRLGLQKISNRYREE